MRTIIRLTLAASILVGTCSVTAFADGTDPPPCFPSDPACPKNPKVLGVPSVEIPILGVNR